MKLITLALLSLFISIPIAFADPAHVTSQAVTVVFEAYPNRGVALFSFKNNTSEKVNLLVMLGEANTTKDAQESRVVLAPNEERSETFKLGTIGKNPLLVVDYSIEFSSVSRRAFTKVPTTPKFFMFNSRDQSYSPQDARVMILSQRALYKRDETRNEEATLDLGANYKTPSKLELRAFYPNTVEDQNIDVVPVQAPLPTVLAGVLRAEQLPTDIVVNRPLRVIVPYRPQQFMNQTFTDSNKDYAGCDVMKCFGGQLKVRPVQVRIGIPAAWGWRVELWRKGIFGYAMVATDETDMSGSWFIKVDAKKADDSMLTIFKPINRFINVIDPATNNTYQYSDTVQRDVVKVSLYQGAAEYGVAKIFNYGSKLWVRLSNGKINPISYAGPYRFIYPNTLQVFGGQTPCTYDDNGTLKPWSCSTSNGIYLIAGHDNQETVTHELAHSIHRLFWKKFPEGSGGSHSATQCYNRGLALVEGFAYYISAWSASKSYDDKVAPIIAGQNVETFKSACNTAINELDVTATFWDLYDTQNEQLNDTNNDSITYYSDTNLIADFLQAGKQSGMPAYMIYLITKHPEVQNLIFNHLFRLNGTNI